MEHLLIYNINDLINFVGIKNAQKKEIHQPGRLGTTEHYAKTTR